MAKDGGRSPLHLTGRFQPSHAGVLDRTEINDQGTAVHGDRIKHLCKTEKFFPVLSTFRRCIYQCMQHDSGRLSRVLPMAGQTYKCILKHLHAGDQPLPGRLITDISCLNLRHNDERHIPGKWLKSNVFAILCTAEQEGGSRYANRYPAGRSGET